MRKTKIYIVAGEASGDLHASNLMKAILVEEVNVDFRFWGGDKMKSVQDNCVKHIEDLAFMGFSEVIMNIRTILGNISLCKEDIKKYNPDALVLVDYPGFNLRIAEWAHEQGIQVHYYISPQVWAWKQSRVKKIKRCVDKMYVILPFEQAFYQKFDFDVEYVGHPLLDEITDFRLTHENVESDFREKHNLDERPILAVLPGSRKQEISVKLPIMMEAASRVETHQIVVAGAPSIKKEYYQQFVSSGVKVIHNETYSLLSVAHTGIVTSGTATLETALFNVPEVVCYKGSNVSYQIAKRLVKINYISLVNLIMDKEVVKELIQKECNSNLIFSEVDRLINDISYRKEMLDTFQLMNKNLGGGGASKKVAQSLLKTIRH